MKHTSGSAPSLCIAKGIREYFQTGKMPNTDVLCDADIKPLLRSGLESTTTTTMMMAAMEKDLADGERVLMQAMMNEVKRLRGPL